MLSQPNYIMRSRLTVNAMIAYYYLFYGSARGVMVIVVGIGHNDTSSNPGRD